MKINAIKARIVFLGLLIISCTKEDTFKYDLKTQADHNALSGITSFYVGQLYGGGIVIYVDSTGRHCFVIDTLTLDTLSVRARFI